MTNSGAPASRQMEAQVSSNRVTGKGAPYTCESTAHQNRPLSSGGRDGERIVLALNPPNPVHSKDDPYRREESYVQGVVLNRERCSVEARDDRCRSISESWLSRSRPHGTPVVRPALVPYPLSTCLRGRGCSFWPGVGRPAELLERWLIRHPRSAAPGTEAPARTKS